MHDENEARNNHLYRLEREPRGQSGKGKGIVEDNTTRKSLYLNQLCKGVTELGPNLLSEVLKETERRLGRRHNEDGIVVIDLDLLQYDKERFHIKDWERNYVKDLMKEL